MLFFRNIVAIVFLTVPVFTSQGQEWARELRAFYTESDSCVTIFRDPDRAISQIILVRHAEPDLDKKGWRNRKEAIHYFREYDSSGVIPFPDAPICTGTLVDPVIYSSALPRAAQTAYGTFNNGFKIKENDRFREFERKVMKFCNVKMPLKCWTVNSRLLWFLGMNDKGIERFRMAKERARGNAAFLVEESSRHEQVVLVAHGLHNRYVMKYLKKQGWKVVLDQGNGYLSVKILARREADK